MYLLFIKIIIALFFSSSDTATLDDWQDWRGPNRNGTWNEKGILKRFDSDKLKIKWSAPVSAGYSGPTVSDNRVYLTDRITKPASERVLCFDAKTGESIWSFSYDCDYFGIGYPAGPRASVVIDGNQAYSLGAMGHLFCFDKATGDVLWKRDLNEEYEIRMLIWGISAAPLIVDNMLILNIGGSDNACIVALDKLTGKELWRSLEDDASYSAPILIQQAGKPVLIVWTGQHIVGLDPKTGKVYWQQEFTQKRMVINIATPVIYDHYLFLSSFYDGSMLLKLGENDLTASVVWRREGRNERNTDALHCCISTPLIVENLIYGVDSYGELRCLDLETGDRIWEDLTAVKSNRWANIHFIEHDQFTVMFNEHGELILANLSKEGFEEIDRAKLIEPTTAQLNRSGTGVTWAHPAFANKHVFARSDKELVCADLSDK
jgi:outer membrane protein assembly factor BamB